MQTSNIQEGNWAATALVLAALALVGGCGSVKTADLIIVGGRIHTMNPDAPDVDPVGLFDKSIRILAQPI